MLFSRRLLVPPDSMPEKDLLTAKNASAASKKMASSVVFTSTAVIEALCIYGRHLCERTLTATATNHQSLLLVALEAVIGRLTTLTAAFVKPKASSAASGPSSYEAMLIAATHINDLKLKTLLVSFYTTVLFVHGCKMPLLVVLIKLAFQVRKKPHYYFFYLSSNHFDCLFYAICTLVEIWL